MTREQFVEEVCTWSDLLMFCSEEGLDICDDIYTPESRNEQIDSDARDYLYEYGWQDTIDYLRDRENEGTYDCYVYDGGDWNGTDDGDDTFEEYKRYVIDYMDDNAEWDEDEDEDDEEWDEDEEPYYERHHQNTDDDEDDGEPIEEDFTLVEVFTASSVCLKPVNRKDAEETEGSLSDLYKF